jgi:hypothetical protein
MERTSTHDHIIVRFPATFIVSFLDLCSERIGVGHVGVRGAHGIHLETIHFGGRVIRRNSHMTYVIIYRRN